MPKVGKVVVDDESWKFDADFDELDPGRELHEEEEESLPDESSSEEALKLFKEELEFRIRRATHNAMDARPTLSRHHVEHLTGRRYLKHMSFIVKRILRSDMGEV